jgi:hypothetical protein
MANSEPVTSTVLDRLVPTFQAAERHSTTIAASADQVWAALAQVSTGELGLFRLLMSLRVLPGRLLVLQPEIVTWLVREGPSWSAVRAATGDDPVVCGQPKITRWPQATA